MPIARYLLNERNRSSGVTKNILTQAMDYFGPPLTKIDVADVVARASES